MGAKAARQKESKKMTDKYTITQIAEPAIEPVSVSELKSFLRITHEGDDALLTDMIKAARMFCENYTGKVFISRTFKIVFDRLNNNRIIPLAKGPLVSVSNVKTFDVDGNDVPISSDNYIIDTNRIVMNDGANLRLPARDTRILEVNFTAGYGNAAADVPESIKQAILMKATYMYEQRGDIPVSAPFDMIASLLKPYKKIGVA